MPNFVEAKREIFELFETLLKKYIDEGLPNENPPIDPLVLTRRNSVEKYYPKVYWQNKQDRGQNNKQEHYLALSVREVKSPQSTLAGGRAQAVGTQYTSEGVAKVEIYFSKGAYETYDGDVLSLMIQRCFRQQSTPCGVWFRNAVIVDMEPEESFFRTNVLAEYRYDSVIK